MKPYVTLNGIDFMHMVTSGSQQLERHTANLNKLNVFPVPDGDTGTNMSLTWQSGLSELQHQRSQHFGKAANGFYEGLLMGARGNSGIILSQLFRGFAEMVRDMEQLNTQQFAAALQAGVETAYRAVVHPVEGTILTISKAMAGQAMNHAVSFPHFSDFFADMIICGEEALMKTPDLLPVLKQSGVVDAGSQGLLYIFRGLWYAIDDTQQNEPVQENGSPFSLIDHTAQETSIPYGYCTEFFINKPANCRSELPEESIRQEFNTFGDSLLTIKNDDCVKVHIHTEVPEQILQLARKYGELSRIKIENMRDQMRKKGGGEVGKG